MGHLALLHKVDEWLYLPDVARTQGITAEPYGFGQRLGELVAPSYEDLCQPRSGCNLWSMLAARCVCTGASPGTKDLANFNASLPESQRLPAAWRTRVTRRRFVVATFLDFGIERKICCDQGVLRLDLVQRAWLDRQGPQQTQCSASRLLPFRGCRPRAFIALGILSCGRFS